MKNGLLALAALACLALILVIHNIEYKEEVAQAKTKAECNSELQLAKALD